MGFPDVHISHGDARNSSIAKADHTIDGGLVTLAADQSAQPGVLPPPGVPMEAASPDDPRKQIRDRLTQLYDQITSSEKDPQKNQTFQFGKDLHEFGILSQMAGSPPDLVRSCLAQSNLVMMQAKDKPANADALITDASIDYGRALLRPMPQESTKQRQLDVTTAEDLLGWAFSRAEKEPRITAQEAQQKKPGRTAEDLAGILQLRAQAQFADAALLANSTSTDEGTKAYTDKLQDVIEGMNVGLNLLADKTGSWDRAQQADMYSMLAYAQDRQEAQEGGISRALDYVWSYAKTPAAMDNYRKAIGLWQQFDPSDASVPQEQRQSASVMQDRQLLLTLQHYLAYTTRMGYADETKSTRNFIDQIYQAHPEWMPGQMIRRHN